MFLYASLHPSATGATSNGTNFCATEPARTSSGQDETPLNGLPRKHTYSFPSSSNGVNNTDVIHLHWSLISLLWKGRRKKAKRKRKMGNRGKGVKVRQRGREWVGWSAVRNSCHLQADENEWLTIEGGWIQQSPYAHENLISIKR